VYIPGCGGCSASWLGSRWRGGVVPGDSNVLLRVPSGTKAEWQAAAAGEGLSLTGWIFSAVESMLGVGKDAGVLVATPPGGAAAAAHQLPSEPELGAATSTPVASAAPLPVPAAKTEPASTSVVGEASPVGARLPVSRPEPKPRKITWRDPIDAPPPQRQHGPRCDCMVCKG